MIYPQADDKNPQNEETYRARKQSSWKQRNIEMSRLPCKKGEGYYLNTNEIDLLVRI
jgi:hypothetical protein